MKNNYSEYIVFEDKTLLETLKLMDSRSTKLLIITCEYGKYKNLISIGDIQRSLIKGHSLSDKISDITIDNKVIAKDSDSEEEVENLLIKLRANFIPIVDENNQLINVVFWDSINPDICQHNNDNLSDIPVVIMAGGKGTRLKPISNILPKPLVPLGSKTILEEIMGRFTNYGCEKFYLSVNYKKEMIKYYLDTIGKSEIVEYFQENKPLGTGGSLSLIKGKIKNTFFVTNCDVLIDQDLNELVEYHKSNKNEITLVSVVKDIAIPYGTLTSGENGILETMEEKPNFTFNINSGVYLLEPHLLEEIPEDTFFHITELIDNVKKRGGQVGVFPISEKSWLDIGEWPVYIETVRRLSGGGFDGL